MKGEIEKTSILVGLTGQTGAGKTLVSTLLSNLGYRVIDADVVARQVVAKGAKCTLDLAVEFGIEILNADGTLNRRKLGNIVFNDKQKRIALNRITFPYIQEAIFEQVNVLKNKGYKTIFLDAPTLIESGTHKRCDKVVSVIAPLETRMARIIDRDKISEEEAMARIGSQHEDEYYTAISDYVICNDGDMRDLRSHVSAMLESICGDVQQTQTVSEEE